MSRIRTDHTRIGRKKIPDEMRLENGEDGDPPQKVYFPEMHRGKIREFFPQREKISKEFAYRYVPEKAL
jgi:hypothetical protein